MTMSVKPNVVRAWSALREFQAGLFQTSVHLVPWTNLSVVESNAVQKYNWKGSNLSSPWLFHGPWSMVNEGSWEMGFKSVLMIKAKVLMQLHRVMKVWDCTFWLLAIFVMLLSLNFQWIYKVTAQTFHSETQRSKASSPARLKSHWLWSS